MTEEFIRRDVFEEYKVSINARFDNYEKRMDRIHTSLHNLRNDLVPIFALPRRVEDLVDDIKNMPRKEDLDYQTHILTTRIEESEKARIERENQKWRTIQLMFWILGGIGTVLGIISLIVTLSRLGKGQP